MINVSQSKSIFTFRTLESIVHRDRESRAEKEKRNLFNGRDCICTIHMLSYICADIKVEYFMI